MSDLHVDPRIEHASTLPSAFYKDPAWFEMSKDAVFARSWQWIGHIDQAKVAGAVPAADHREAVESMFKAASLGIIISNSNGIIEQVNPYTNRLFGYEEG